MIIDTKLIVEDVARPYKTPVRLKHAGDRIEFIQSPFALKDAIKSMQGAKWHGFDANPRKIWSIVDSPRNRFQLEWLEGGNPYERFERPIQELSYRRDLMRHQREAANQFFAYRYGIVAMEPGVGKTLVAIEVMERVDRSAWWVGPKSSLPNMEREFAKWGCSARVELLTYNAMVERAKSGLFPAVLVCDESTNLKTCTSNRSKAAQWIADQIRGQHGDDGSVLLMTGTPAPKTPIDWWSQAEIAWPGFLREGSPKALEQRLAFLEDVTFDAGTFPRRSGWRDNPSKCNVCGNYQDHTCHVVDHTYKPSENEVENLYRRLEGLAFVRFADDCIDLPEKRFHVLHSEPSDDVKMVADVILKSSDSAITALTKHRELSDGFQYREVTEGTTACNHCEEGTVEEWTDDSDRNYTSLDMLSDEIQETLRKMTVPCPVCKGTRKMPKVVRKTIEVDCPKDDHVRNLLDKYAEVGRLVLFAGFTGSLERLQRICLEKKWDVVRCDGKGFYAIGQDGKIPDKPLDYWSDSPNKVAFVAHPESGGMSFTLIEARAAVFYSNSFKSEFRFQAIKRIDRIGSDVRRGIDIYDLTHLPTDQKVLDTLSTNRRLERMSMGELVEALK